MGKRSRPNKKGRNHGQFILLPRWLTRSPAWKTMSPNAKALLLDVWERHNGSNNGDISYAVREAEEIGLSKDQTSRAFKELCERGFLKMRKASSFTLKTKEARTWELTAEPTGPEGTVAPTKEFMTWTENGSRSHQRDAQSHQRDREAGNERKLPVSVAPARPSGQDQAPSRSHQRDTYTIPGRAALRAASAQQPAEHLARPAPGITCPPAQPASPTSDQPRSARTAGGPEQIDLEELTGRANQPHPDELLRAATIAWCDREGKGAHKRLADLIGLSTYHLSNFKSGRFALNATAKAMLREVVLGQRAA